MIGRVPYYTLKGGNNETGIIPKESLWDAHPGA
jgi:hypothetical protein